MDFRYFFYHFLRRFRMNLFDKYQTRLNDVKKGREGTATFVPSLYDLCLLVDQTLQEINRGWKPGASEWTKANRPDEWGKMLILECHINEMVLGGNQEGLRGVLDQYRGLILQIVKEFKSQPVHGRQGTLPLRR